MFTAVTVGVARASSVFLAGDSSEAARLAEAGGMSVSVLSRVEHELERTMVLQAPVASDLRFMLTALRIVPQLERCAELTAHIAERATFVTELPEHLVSLFEAMATVTVRMWEAASTAWAAGDPRAAAVVDEEDDELDVLAAELTAALAGARLGVYTAMECRLVVRFYERLGDHAVHICERIRWWATGAEVHGPTFDAIE